jgi:hypothetical protein
MAAQSIDVKVIENGIKLTYISINCDRKHL